MSRVKFAVAAILGLVVTLSSSDVFAQDCCCDTGYNRAPRVGIFARIRANRAAYTNCCPTPATDCCATPAPCCQPAPCCPTTSCYKPRLGRRCCDPCCTTTCCAPAPTCCDTGCGHCCHRGVFARVRGNNCCYTSTACGGCSGCGTGGLIQGTSEGVAPEATGQPVMPAPETPAPSGKNDT